MKLALPELLRPHVDGRLPAEVEPRFYEGGHDVEAAARDAEVLYTHFWSPGQNEAAIASAAALRWVATTSAGVDALPLGAMRRRGIALTNGAGLHSETVAEFTVMCVLAAAKNLPGYVHATDRHEWLQPAARREVIDSRALVVGYGAIGEAIGRRLRAFGVEVTGVRRRHSEEAVIGADEWRPRLAEFDWVILAAAATPDTAGMVGAAELSAMAPSGWLFNIARGSLVDQPALVEALHAGEIAGAYLDATEPEPLPPDDPLWAAPNVVVTGHSSGASATRIPERAAALLLDNLARYLAGEPLRNLVDLDRGY